MDLYLYDLFDIAVLHSHVANGFVSVTKHPDDDLWVLNYTAAAQYSGTWDDVTRQSRGLVVRGEPFGDSPVVIARPLPKFHNAVEHMIGSDLPPLDLSALVRVTDKKDGSLGVLHRRSDGTYGINTRGSFASDQALWATAHWNEVYGDVEVLDGCTYLFEILYPENRIVVDYGDVAGLCLLAVRDTHTGAELALPADWPGMVVESFEFSNLAAVIDYVETAPLEQQRNVEGFVVAFDDGLRVKVKYQEYVRLHRILTNIDARRLYEYAGVEALANDFLPPAIARALHMPVGDVEQLIAAGSTVAGLLEDVPDEFYNWVKFQLAEFDRQVAELRDNAQRIVDDAPASTERRVLAEYFLANELAPGIGFRLLEGQSSDLDFWRAIRPDAVKPFVIDS